MTRLAKDNLLMTNKSSSVDLHSERNAARASYALKNSQIFPIFQTALRLLWKCLASNLQTWLRLTCCEFTLLQISHCNLSTAATAIA